MIEQFENQFFNPSNPMESGLLGDKLFLLFFAIIGIIIIIAEIDKFKNRESDDVTPNEHTVKSNEEVDSIEGNDSNMVSDAIKEALKPTPVVYDTPVVNVQQTNEGNGRIRRVTTTVVEYDDGPTQETAKILRIKCPACGTINNVPENGTAQCTSCLKDLQAVKR